MKKMRFLVIALLLFSLLVSVACAKSPAAPTPMPVPRPETVPAPQVMIDKGTAYSGITMPSLPEDRMIIRNGDMSLVVKDVVQSRDEIAQLATTLGGYVVSSSVSGRDQELRGNIAIRVPDSKFEQGLSELRRLAVRVNSERTSSQDVTEEYVDLQSRLKNAVATENQYLLLLEKADKVEDILRVYERLSQVRQEIEQIKGRMQYLERTSSMSLISIRLEPETAATPTGAWSFLEALKTAVRGIVIFGQWLVTIIIWIVIFSPLWGAITGVILWRRRKKKAAS